MNKLDELEKSLKEYKALLEKNAQMGYGADAMSAGGGINAEPIAAPGVNTAMGKKEMKPAPEGSKNRESYEKEFGKKEDHKDEKEDKKIIAEAIDDHNENKHGESKDKDSAYKDMKVKKEEGDYMVKFDANGQWRVEKAETTDKIQRVAPSARQDAKVTTAEGTKVMSPADQMKAKQDKAASNKATAEAAAAERRAQYRKEGKLK